MKIIFKILIYLFLFLPQIIFAQYKNLQFENFTRDDGLSASLITCVLQDKEGFIWFGTLDVGLNRYDGYSFKQYKNIPNEKGTISNNFIMSLYEDKSGILWVGTMFGGMNKFDKTKEEFASYMHNSEDSSSISDNCVNSICRDHKDILWLGTSKGLDMFDEKNNRFIRCYKILNDTNFTIVAGAPNAGVTSICEDRLGNLWFGTNEGLNRFDREKGTVIYYKNITGDTTNISNCIVHSIYEDKEGSIWIGTTNGLIKLKYFNEDNYSFKTYYLSKNKYENNISSIYRDANGLLWIGTFGNGLFIFDPVKEYFSTYKNNPNDNHSLKNDRISVNSITEDKSGTFWIGTKLGVSKYSQYKNKFNFYPFNEPIQRSSIFEDKKGNVWIAGKDDFHIRDSSGIFRIITYEMPYKSNIGSGLVYAGFSDKSGVIWLGYHSLLNTYNPVTGKLTLFYDFYDSTTSLNPYFTFILEDSENLLWVSTMNGLWVINKERTNVQKYNYKENDPYSINSDKIIGPTYEDKNSATWIPLIFKGLDKYDKKTGKFYHYLYNPSDSNSISGNYVTSIHDDGKGSLWIATGGGLDKLDLAANVFTHYTEKDGLADNYTLWMLPDNSGNLWLATNSGVSRFNPLTKTFRNYDMEDGLQGVEFFDYGLRTRKGEMFFAGANGINYFFPDSVKENKHIPPVIITSFKIFDKETVLDNSITKTDEIKLSYKENFFSFEFAALDFTNPKKNHYKYILEGVDKEWRNSGNVRTAAYTNINPGEYVFRVKGSNNDGLWNEDGASIRIIITPPFWATWWFRLIAILLILGIAVSAIKLRFKALKNEKKMQEDFTRQIISAHEEERKRISGELHDSLGQNLLIVKNLSLLGIKHPERNPEIVNNIEKISSSIIQEVRNIAYNLFPYQLERLGLTKALESITERALKSSEIKFTKEIETIDNIFNQEEEINMYRIIQECINNIIKHSEAKRASLKIKKTGRDLLITISDNGKGFNVNEILSDKSKSGIGLINIKERLKLLDGTFEIKSAPGKGTKFKFIIPLIDVYKTL